MIVVTGAAGQLGRAVVDGLLARLPAGRIVAAIRAARETGARRVLYTARRGDFAAVDPTLEALLGRRPRTMRDILAAALRRPDAKR